MEKKIQSEGSAVPARRGEKEKPGSFSLQKNEHVKKGTCIRGPHAQAGCQGEGQEVLGAAREDADPASQPQEGK